MERIILHIDVNNAFLSWTAVYMLNNGYSVDIRTIPAVISGSKEKRSGIVLAKSMPAKKMGVKTAETLFLSFKKCPNLKTFPPNYQLYSDMSNKLFSFLKTITPDIEIASIDECYMDYGKIKRLYGDEVSFAYKLKNYIKKKFGFTVNIGIANNKLCAKMASDFEKPDKVHTLCDSEIKGKMYPLPISDLFGVGKSTSEKLIKIGINTIGDLANFDCYKLSKYFKSYNELINKAKGIDTSEVDSSTFVPKGISNEITLPFDIDKKEELYPYLKDLSKKVSLRLKEDGKYAYVVCVILKDNFFKRYNHQKKLKNPINTPNEIYEIAKVLLNQMMGDKSIRLIGIRLEDLSDKYLYQTSLFDESDKIEEKSVDKLIDDINKKYGTNLIKKGYDI